MKLLSSLKESDLSGKKVIVRGDLDISEISENDLRLKSLIPTLKYLQEKKAKIILIGHSGRPEGKVNNGFSLKPVSEILEKMLQTKINFVFDIAGVEAKEESDKLQDGQIMMLENLRFDSREEENNEDFAKSLSSLGEIFINEAFSVCHRSHASIVGIPKFLPSYAGLNLEKEIENLNNVFDPIRPLVILISGVKDDKIKMIEPLSNLADKVLVGGRLPDFMGDNTESVRTQNGKIIVGNLVMDKEDITLNTIEKFKEEVAKAKTIVLAGVLGKYEDEGHSQGTKEIFSAIAATSAFKIVGGGDSLTAIQKYSLTEKFDWVSVGGGAMLDFLTQKTLVGIEALTK
ncbi:MAG: phosphoglycerate kinase [Microgenomates group bacterium]